MNRHIKNIIIINSIIGILALQLMSCTKILDKNPLDQISSNDFWKTQADADMALAGVYTRLNSNTFNFYQSYLDVLGGDAIDYLGYVDLAHGYMYPTSSTLISSAYTNCYTGISSCNFFLENIDRVPIGDDKKNKYKAEVMLLRALFYFTLSDFYGGVPLYTKSITIDEAKVQQSTKAEIVTQVLTDLEFAIANLPNTAYSGHAVKGSALALKAKVLLHNQQWQGAADAANQVIQDGNFSLTDNYKNLFLASGQTNNPEIIFSTRYQNPDVYSDQDIWQLWLGALNVRPQLVDDFECTDGLPISSSPLYDPAYWNKNRDPRLIYTVKFYTDSAVTSTGKVISATPLAPPLLPSGWEPNKGVNVDGLPMGWDTKSEADWILMRYAEVLLMYAEAKNEASGPDASVYNAINVVRARPGIAMPPIPTGLSKEQMRIRIMHERRVELGLEGRRYSDMKRWKTIETYLPSIVDPGGLPGVFDPAKNYVLPFPQSEIDINPKLVQNPGY